MDFRQTVQPNSRPAGAPVPSSGTEVTKKVNRGSSDKWLRVLNTAILFGVAVLVASIAFSFTRSDGANEFKYVNSKDYQAVFLNNGQVYFGNVNSLNTKYVELTNVFYLTQSTATGTAGPATATNGSYTLVKLGCQQIHDPYDQMLINRDQVTFWENLNDSGKVVTSIKQFQKANPNGPDCSQVSNQTQASGGSATQGAADTATPSTTPATPTTNKTKP